MPKSWSKPFIALLTSRSDDWVEAKGRPAKKVIVQEIIEVIEGMVDKDDKVLEDLDDVCLFQTCQ
jgi:hypothetical protein